MLFFGDFLRQWGVEPIVYKVGRHKNAPEPYERGFPSPTNRRDLEELLVQYREMFLGPLKDHPEREALETALEKGIFSLEEALEHGLIDAVRFGDRVEAYLKDKEPVAYELPERPRTNEEIQEQKEAEEKAKEESGSKKKKKKKKRKKKKKKDSDASSEETEDDDSEILIDFDDYELARPSLIHWKPVRRKPLVGVVPVIGNIVDEAEGGLPSQDAGAVRDHVVEALEQAAMSRRVKAVVVFVDSRGGSGYASEAMWRAVKRVREQKPVVAFFADYAASGGYYVGCGAQHIVCAPTGVTGSIGVFGGKFLLRNVMKNLNIGVTIVGETEGTRLFSPFTEGKSGDVERVQEQMQLFYQRFLSRVGENRGMTLEQVHELAEGRVYLGTKALEIGLVDEVGTFGTAIKAALELADVPEADIALFRTQKRLSNLERLMDLRASMPKTLGQQASVLQESQQMWTMLQQGTPLLWHPPMQWEGKDWLEEGLALGSMLKHL
jgi:signal peptide peptidase SppA